ncbi:MAG: ATP-binding protein [Chloroflexota bacterium]
MSTFREVGLPTEALFEQMASFVHVMRPDGTVIYANPFWQSRLGVEVSEKIAPNFLDTVLVKATSDGFHQVIQALHQQPSVTVSDIELQTASGAKIHVYGQCIGAYEDGTLQSVTCLFYEQDVSDSTPTIYQPTQSRMHDILDNSGTIIGVKSMQGDYTLVNQAFADVFGTGDKAYFVGKYDNDIFPLGTADIFTKHDAAILESGRSMQFEEHISTDEGLRTYLTTRFLLIGADGFPDSICMIAKDITYRKLTEMQLLMRNQAIEHSPSGISIADAQLPDMPLIYINPTFERTTGYSTLDAIGRNCRFLQGNDHDQEGVRQLRQAINNEDSITVVLRNYRKDGSLFYNELSIAPIHDNAGHLTHYVGISTDVTERIEADEKIQHQNQELVEANYHLALARKEAEKAATEISRQNEALVKANTELAHARKQAEDATRLKSQFLATMSHELRTPLNAIIGYTEIQLAGMTGDLNDEQRDYQARVLTNADHLLNLINDVLDISKIEAGRLELVHKPFVLPDWLNSVDAQMRVLAEEKGLDFVVEIDERMPDRIFGDPARVRQVVINLLSNAVKFTEVGHIRLQIRKHGRDAWKIIVGDTGIGIPPHMQETIFEEFRQVDASSRRKAGGTGLGLAIVRKLVLTMGGNVRVNSQLGEGSTFTITLPLLLKNVYRTTSNTELGDADS